MLSTIKKKLNAYDVNEKHFYYFFIIQRVYISNY